MAGQTTGHLNRLERDLPEGLLVDSPWLRDHGFSRQLISHYVNTGWLEPAARGVYRRPRGQLTWQHAVISLQTLLLRNPLLVGGRTALELQGFAHYLQRKTRTVHLYGPKPPPAWLSRLPLDVTFVFHNDSKLFRNEPITRGLGSLKWDLEKDQGARDDPYHDGLKRLPWGQWDWPLSLSTPERAVLELLNELPARESFHQVDKLFEGLTTLSPRRLQKLLADCRSIKVKRLFFFFAARHSHSWVKRIDRQQFDLGKGKRSLVKAGRLDPATQITVPGDLDGDV